MSHCVELQQLREAGEDETALLLVLDRMRDVHCLTLAQVALNVVAAQGVQDDLEEQLKSNSAKMHQVRSRHGESTATNAPPVSATTSGSVPESDESGPATPLTPPRPSKNDAAPYT